MPKWPNIAVMARNDRECVRPVVWAVVGPTWVPTSSGGRIAWVQRWIVVAVGCPHPVGAFKDAEVDARAAGGAALDLDGRMRAA
jgi:hypothetical protein